MDSKAFNVESALKARSGEKPPEAPVLSADFLLNYLAFGPIREKVSRDTEKKLPLLIDAGLVRYLTPEVLDEAAKLRDELSGLQEHVIRRRVRDMLNNAKRRIGKVAKGGIENAADEV